ncbi:P-II family nitrogen regulator [Halodesulfovibrio sp.]|jgi:nitrogen regulatory protein P-II 1|uniref:P-II family nitrogen regulator n=1 Tax=Halodesulfovibrio sp. TaxID=1912772 RepID=UPI0025ED3875|nr:P-II family nitrogen regulator [Halodesulfovibrio sp.]MCT4535070.1 P-II family nitrogen regulator [Halodesulfovibrio sp.]MCT4625946.1 P-II family nitrogen regulator [Halodesulfovibrio sp.]
MKNVVAFIRPERLPQVKQELFARELFGLSVTNILGSGQQKGFTETYRGVTKEVNLLKKLRIELVVQEERLNDAIAAIESGAKTETEGDGIIYFQNIHGVRRIRTGEEL